MAQTKGVVGNTSAKDWAGRNGTVVLYSFQLEGDRQWYRCGTSKPPFVKGDSIQFDYVEDAKGAATVKDGSIVKVAATEAVRAPAVKTGKVSENWDARAAYWDAKEKREIEVVEPRITLSASRTAAIGVVGLALAHEAIAFGNASKGARLGIILDAIDEVTSRYYAQSMKKIEFSTPDNEQPDAVAAEFDDGVPFGD